jgi:hypothetical protein
LTKRPGSDRVHCAGLKVHQDCTWYIFTTGGLIVIDIYSLQLQIRVTMVGASRINTVLVGDDLPKLQTKQT